MMENQDFGPVIENQDFGPVMENQDFGSVIENQDFGSVIEELNLPGKAQLGLFVLCSQLSSTRSIFISQELVKNSK